VRKYTTLCCFYFARFFLFMNGPAYYEFPKLRIYILSAFTYA